MNEFECHSYYYTAETTATDLLQVLLDLTLLAAVELSTSSSSKSILNSLIFADLLATSC